ncbi:MAG: hypothetical protein KAX18_08000 [Candidatus Lokiarchaeota archaeon]|nr:hypothetical protein [Candidatus Lokiarchaeota archaeon]
MEEEENSFSKEELEIFYEVLFKRIMDLIKKPEINLDPFGEMINKLSVLSGVFSFKGMISLIPELIASSIRYGMMVEKAYEEEQLNLDEDQQGLSLREEQERRISKMREDLDKVSLYL